jgi:hypothetical protein
LIASTRAAVAVLLLFCPVAPAADVADPAALFPAGTLAYVELHDPAELAPQLGAVVKGTPLQDSIPFIHNRRDTTKNFQDIQGKQELALLGLLASPEMLAEFKRLRGVAVGLTGFSERGDPEAVLAVLTGDSQAAGLAARAFLTMDGTVRKVGAIGAVPVYQFRTPAITGDPATGRPKLASDKPPTEGPYEATFAYVPGLFAVGTSKAALAEVITRFTAEGKPGGSLLEAAGFKEAAVTHRRPGLFFFVNAPAFCDKYEAAQKARGDLVGPDLYAWFKLAANAKAVRTVAGSARFRDGGLAVTIAATFDPAHKSPLAEFLGGTGTRVDLLHHAARPAVFAAAFTFPEKDRPAAVIGFLDALAKATGELGRLPGEAVRELEGKYKVPITDGLIGKTRAVTVVLPVKQVLPKGAVPLPMLVLHTEDPATAAAWEDFLPKLVADLGMSDPPPAPVSETINGVKVFSLAGAGLPWNAAVHYARKGATFAVGLDRNLVASAVSPDPANSVLGGDNAAAGGVDGAAMIGTFSPGEVVRLLAEPDKPQGPVVPVQGPRPPGGPPGSPPVSEQQRKDEEKALADLVASFGTLPPSVVTVRRAGQEVRLELWQPKVQDGGLAGVIGAALGWYDKVLDRSATPGGYPVQRVGGIRRR